MSAAAPVRVPDHVPLLHMLRSGMTEGVHYGSVVVLAPDGSTLFEAGDVDAAFYPRSAAKPMQAVAMNRLGLALPPRLLALSAASHSGEQIHLHGAEQILTTAGFHTRDLGNPEDFPYDPVQRDRWLATRRSPSKLAHNCSGKHAAMLAACHLRGWSTADYLDPGHPLQQAIAETVEDLSGQPVARVAVDGCGAPLFAVSQRGLATAISRIARAAAGSSEGLVAQAIRAHPEMVAGTRRDVTKLMNAVPGLIAKDGFEGVQVAALADGTSIVVKVADGSDRARQPVLAAVLTLCGVDAALLKPFAGTTGEDGLKIVGALAERLREVK
ncbi:MAG: L-asparaginase [Amycolatopsis sp.]|nr:L-asparaginase [Amycolatopsis sp.]